MDCSQVTSGANRPQEAVERGIRGERGIPLVLPHRVAVSSTQLLGAQLSETYLVTGGNGYIGSHMCRLLAQHGATVHVVDNHAASPAEPVHGYGTFHRMDIASAECGELIAWLRPTAVFHFAALANVPQCQADPLRAYRDNVAGSLALFQHCVEAGVRRVVLSSSCAVLGEPEVELLDESLPLRPASVYGHTKAMVEQMLGDLCSRGSLDGLVLRYFNAAGAAEDGSLAENHRPETHLIPRLIDAHLAGEQSTFCIYGDDYDTPDGTCVRDYIHVEDLARAHLLAERWLVGKEGMHTFHLGSGKGYSVREVIEVFEKVVGARLPSRVGPRRPGDVARLVASVERARAELGFEAKWSLEDAIRHALASRLAMATTAG